MSLPKDAALARELRPASLIRAELMIANVLRYGVLLCGLILAVGILMTIFAPGGPDLLKAVQHSDVATIDATIPRTLAAFAAGLGKLDPNTVIAVGLVLLIALPIVRVALTCVLFVMERDWVYAAITGFVFAVLIAGILLGKSMA